MISTTPRAQSRTLGCQKKTRCTEQNPKTAKDPKEQLPTEEPTEPTPTTGTQHRRKQTRGTGGSTSNVEPAQPLSLRIKLPTGEIVCMKMSTRTQKRKQHKPRRGLVVKLSTETEAEKSETKAKNNKRKRENETEESQDKSQRKQMGKEKKIENIDRLKRRNSDTQRKIHTSTHTRKQKPKTCEKPRSGPIDKYLVKLGNIEPSVAAESIPSGENQDNRSISSVYNYVKSKSGASPRGIEGGEPLKAPLLLVDF